VSEFEEKLDLILNNPQMMNQIMSLAKSLGNSADSPSDNLPESDSMKSASGNGLPEGLDPSLLSGFISVLTSSTQENDDKTALLQALRPFVSDKRLKKLDKAIQIAKVSRLIRMALELYRTKEDSHV